MTNDEIRMTKECLNDETRKGHTLSPSRSSIAFCYSSLGIRHSFVIWISSFVILSVFFFLTPLVARATSPRITGLTPVAAQRGTEVELRLTGQRLDDTQEIVFYEPGIEIVKIESAKTNAIKAQLKVDSNCRLGEYHLRLRTAGGVSELRTFNVVPFPIANEVEPNNAVTNAQKVALNTAIAGSMAQEDLDYFTITAKKGQRISAEVQAIRLGRSAFDSFMSIQDSTGNILTTSDDSSLLQQDSLISIIAPKDDVYTILLRDISYGGGGEFVYLLHVGDFARPTAIYPAGGKAGETVSVKFLGDPKGEFTQQIKLPDTVTEKFGAYAEQNGTIAPSPNWMRVSTFPNVLETSGNNDREHATVADSAPPVALNGIIAKKGESDWFKFTAKKSQPLEIAVYARRLRSPIDSVIEVFDAKGKSLASNDDTSGADSYLKFSPPADGDYFLKVRDQLGQGGLDYVYRVEVRPVSPALALSIPQVARNDSQTRQYIVVPKGNRFATVISAKRKDFSGDLELKLDGLPQGVTMHADTMSAKMDAMPVVFEAAADAPITGKLLELTAKVPDNPVRTAFNHKVELVSGPNNTYYYSTTVDKLYVAVTEPAPFKIRIVEPKVPIVQYGTMDLKIVAERDPGFDQPINVKLMWNPPGVGSLPDVTIAKGETSADYHLNAKEDAQTRKWKIAVIGTATVKGGPVWASSQLATLEVGDPYLLGKIEPVSATPGEKARLVCKLEQKQSFEGKAKVKLLGLPEKVIAPEIEITKDSKEAVFDLQVDSKVPFGSHRQLFCSVTIPKQSETISQNIAPYSVLRIVPPKKKIASAGETKTVAKAETK